MKRLLKDFLAYWQSTPAGARLVRGGEDVIADFLTHKKEMNMKLFCTVYLQFSEFSGANERRTFLRFSGNTAEERKTDFYKKLQEIKAKFGGQYKFIQVSPPSDDKGDALMVTTTFGEIIATEGLETE